VTIDIRPARQADVPAVLELLDAAVRWLTARGRSGQWGTEPLSRNPAQVDQLTGWAADGTLHVAVTGDAVVGALGLGPAPRYAPPADEPELYVTLLVTDRSRAGQDIGGRLLAHARAITRRRRIGLLRVDCYAGGDGALVRYYERQGFTATTRFTIALSTGPWHGQVLEHRLP
jgi:GNAT superfamily N-acetyltransferase